MSSRATRWAAVVFACACLAPAQAFGHAQLQGTSPARGAVVKTEPQAVVFRFDQTVEGNFGAVRAFDASGGRVDQGDAFHPNGRGALLGVHLKPRLPKGTYTATYRVISADGHVVSGGFVFSIGKQGVAPSQTVGQLIAGGTAGAATDIAFGIARGLEYWAIALALGAIGFLFAVWIRALADAAGGEPAWADASRAFVRRLRALVLIAAGLGLLSSCGALVLEGATAAGVSGWSALTPKIVREVLGTRFGTAFGFGVIAWLIFGFAATVMLTARDRAPALRAATVGATGLALDRRFGRGLTALVIAPLAYLAVMPALAGHSSTQKPTALLFPVDVAHVVAISTWVGGIAVLLGVLPVATRALAPSQRTGLLAATVARFSSIALPAVLVIALTGVIQAYVYVRSLDNLVHTAFGRAVLIKSILLLALLALGAYHRRRSIPALLRLAKAGDSPGGTGVRLRRALRAELALFVVVLGVTAALTMYAPSIDAYAGPFSKTASLGPLQLQMTVDPARVGSNQLHLYLLNPKDGTQFTRAREVDVAESLPGKGIGPLNQGASKAGPGHFIVQGALLNVPGTWHLQVTVLVSKFDQYTTSIKVPVR